MTLQTAYSEGIRPGIRTEAGNQDIKKMPSIAPLRQMAAFIRIRWPESWEYAGWLKRLI